MKSIGQAADVASKTGEKEGLICKATVQSLPGIVARRERTFASLLARLGAGSLRKYYRLALEYHSGTALAAGSGTALQGFASGFVEPVCFYQVRWWKRSVFTLPVILFVVRSPHRAPKIFYVVQRTQPPRPSLSCELLSIAAPPQTAGGRCGW